MKTLVIDSRPSFEEPKRTWIVTQRIKQLLDLDLAPCRLHETGGIELIAGEKCRLVRLEHPDWIIERGMLRRLLARAAEDAGAQIELGRRVNEVSIQPRTFTVSLNGRGRKATRISSRHLVGADGVKSMVADAIGAGPQKVVPIVQARIQLPGGYDPDITKVWFDRRRTRFFYWLIPESQDTGVLGLIAERSTNARELLDRFLDERGAHVLDYQGAMIPLHRPLRKLELRRNAGRALLVGDAASHVKVTTVGGVVTGLWGARTAATAIIENTSYKKELCWLHKELWLHDTIRWFMDRFNTDHYERLLGLLNSQLHEVLGCHSRDSMAPKALDLLRAQPGILKLGMAVLLRKNERNPL